MIFVAGAGATAVAARAMRQIQRDLDRRIARFKHRRKARRRARTRAILDHTPVRVDFECSVLCRSCGYLLDEVAEDAEQECPACGDSDWLDLALKPIADRLRDMEAEARNEAPRRVKRIVLAASVALFAVLAVALTAADLGTTTSYLAMLGWIVGVTVLVPLSYQFLPQPLSVLMIDAEEEVPHRWHVPLGLPPADAEPLVAHGVHRAQPGGELLTAPFSGRECIAYQVSVLFDVPRDARPPEWALQEQRASSVRFGDLEIACDQLYLESETEELAPPPDDERDPRYLEIKRYLRQRGLFTSEGEFRLFEARLEPGDSVVVDQHERGLHVVRHVG